MAPEDGGGGASPPGARDPVRDGARQAWRRRHVCSAMAAFRQWWREDPAAGWVDPSTLALRRALAHGSTCPSPLAAHQGLCRPLWPVAGRGCAARVPLPSPGLLDGVSAAPVSVEVLGRCPRWSSVLGRQPCWWWRRRRGGGGVAAASAVGGGTHSVSSPSAVCYMLRGGPHRRKPCRIYRHDDGGAFGRRSPPWRRHLGVSHLLGRLHWASAASWWRGRQWLAWWRRWRRGGVTACCQVGAPVAPWWCGWGSWLLGQEVGARVVAGHGQWRRGVVAARHDSDGKVHIEVPIRQGEEMAKVFYGISEASCLALLGQLKFWQWRDDGEAAEWLGTSEIQVVSEWFRGRCPNPTRLWQ